MLTKNPFAVTSGPLPGSQKIHRPGSRADLKVAMREVVITPESGEAPIALYDTSGPLHRPERADRSHQGPAAAAAAVDSRARRRGRACKAAKRNPKTTA